MEDEEKYKVPSPLYQDPVYGGASDPVVIWNREERQWWMFYTQRRSWGYYIGVSGIHGTKIGIASSPDGISWLYRGTAKGLEFEPGHNTFWAPEVTFAEGQYHMFVSYIQGIPTDWKGRAQILHYTAENLWTWHFDNVIELNADRVIDACIYEIGPHFYKLWYKDEDRNSHTCSAVSHDLLHWELLGEEITDCPHEGPNVFEFGRKKWMITDCWNGLGVYESDDFCHWKRQDQNILQVPGTRLQDQEIGNHADVVVVKDRAYIFYFVHPYFPVKLRNGPYNTLTQKEAVTVIQAAELNIIDGRLVCDRNKDFDLLLNSGSNLVST